MVKRKQSQNSGSLSKKRTRIHTPEYIVNSASPFASVENSNLDFYSYVPLNFQLQSKEIFDNFSPNKMDTSSLILPYEYSFADIALSIIRSQQVDKAIISPVCFRVDKKITFVKTNDFISYVNISTHEAIFYLKQLMQSRDYKIIFIYTILVSQDDPNITHASWTIIDKTRKVVEFFDPRGSHKYNMNTSMFAIGDWSLKFGNLFQQSDTKTRMYIIPKNYTLKTYRDSCPEYGFQTIENYSNLSRSMLDAPGYCMLWSAFFLVLRLNNLHIGTREMQEQVIKDGYTSVKIMNTHIPQNKQMSISDYFLQFIRSLHLFHLQK